MSPRGAGASSRRRRLSRPRCANVSAVFFARESVASRSRYADSVVLRGRGVGVSGASAVRGCMVVEGWARGMSSGGEEGGGRSSARWPVGILRRSGARAARRVLHVKYRSVPPSPAPSPPPAPTMLPLDIDDTVSCFCRCVPVFWPMRYR